MRILVFNPMGSILRYQLIDMPEAKVLAAGACYRIGHSHSCLKYVKTGYSPVILEKDIYYYDTAISEIIKVLTDRETGVVQDISMIDMIACRAVYAGENFGNAVLMDDNSFGEIKEYIENDLFNRESDLVLIEEVRRLLPSASVTAVFDMSYQGERLNYITITDKTYKDLYADRNEESTYGTTHKWAVRRTADLTGKPYRQSKLVSCCLGAQPSIFASDNGKQVLIPDKSYVFDRYMTGNHITNKNQNLFVCPKVDGAYSVNSRFSGNINKHIGILTALMDGIDAIVFTGNDDEKAAGIRYDILRNMEYLGVNIDWQENRPSNNERILNRPDSRVKVLVIPANDELAIAKEAYILKQPVSML
ncbi:MAG: hypothetical protein N3I35_15580 [Clostridia bacterium]|nr:hypothetical protein [Clostridia bacterium]